MQLSNRRGRNLRLANDEEDVIVQVILEFLNNGAPLDRDSLRDLAQIVIKKFLFAQGKDIGFTNDRPGMKWLNLSSNLMKI